MTITAQIIPILPALVEDGPGVDLDVTNGVLSAKLDYSTLPEGGDISEYPTFQIAAQDPDTKEIVALELGDLAGMSPVVYDPQGIEADAFARENHTGTQPIVSIEGLPERLAWLKTCYNVLEEGADPTGATLSQGKIQAALNKVRDAGGGKVFAPACPTGGFYGLGLTAETYPTTYMPPGSQQNYGLLIPENVELVGEGRSTVFKRMVAQPIMGMIMPAGYGKGVVNFLFDGNAVVFPYVGDTYGSGGGIGIESSSITFNFDVLVQNIWVQNTPGYGAAMEWGNHRGLTVDGLFTDGTGSDGIDLKRMHNGVTQFESSNIVLNNIRVRDFGKTATDAALQAGVDIRGYVTASNIHVTGPWGAQAQAGIRLRGGITLADNSVGAQGSNLANYYVEMESGGAGATNGLEVNADDCSSVNGTIKGTSVGVNHLLAGAATDHRRVQHTNVRASNCTTYGFATEVSSHDVTFTACSAYLNAQGYRLAGDRGSIIGGSITQNTGERIEVVAGADNCQIIGPGFSGTAPGTILNNGNGTSILMRDMVNYGDTAVGVLRVGVGSRTVTSGAGSPEGVVTANPGALFLRTNGGAGTSFYVKETGTGNTGWVGK